MKTLIQILGRPVSTEGQDATLVRWMSFAASVAILPLGVRAATHLTETNGELLVAMLATMMLSLQLAQLGVTAPRFIHRRQRRTEGQLT